MIGGSRWSNRRKAFLAAALALLLWAPQGISTGQQPVVTGHSTFYSGDVFDKCLASIAGIIRSRVMWFNDMVLAERYAGKGTFVYVTEHGAQDPTEKNVLYSEGVFFDFLDPNGAHWHIEEVFWYSGQRVVVEEEGDVLQGDNLQAGVRYGQDRHHVWVVEVAERPIYDEFAGPVGSQYYHDLYNFLVLVDTCKMRNNTHTYLGNVNHTGAEPGHPGGTGAHDHESFLADIWIGKRPNIVPVSVGGVLNTTSWQSDWIRSENVQQNAGRAPQQGVNQTAPR